MLISGKVSKEGNYWVASLNLLDMDGQGKTKKEAVNFLSESIELMKEEYCLDMEFELRLEKKTNKVIFKARNTNKLASFILRRQRELNNLTLQDMADILKSKSRNSYARYEKGKTAITLQRFAELFESITNHSLLIS
ncbi:MAG: helix-turn-helix transcriptional regulator [Oligoflexia bacterium]|nr:helix-turn-helix transcriptional regulator [Oligoflexia bacterium]